jgi:hypothetical protein
VLAADLAADPADLLDVSAALGLQFRDVIGALLRAPGRPAPEIVRGLHGSTTVLRGIASGGAVPFVWVSLVPPGHRRSRIVRAGWLEPAAVAAIAAEARMTGAGTEVRIIVPLDGGDGAAARVHALCLDFPLDLRVTIDVQQDHPARNDRPGRRPGGSWWRSSEDGTRGAGRARFRPGTWVVLDPLRAAS